MKFVCLFVMPEEWLVIIIEVFSSPINVAFVPEWPGSSTLSVGLREATVTATSRMGKMTGGGQELGEAKVQGGGEEVRTNSTILSYHHY